MAKQEQSWAMNSIKKLVEFTLNFKAIKQFIKLRCKILLILKWFLKKNNKN